LTQGEEERVKNEYLKDVSAALLEEYVVHTRMKMCFSL
jgi:hypothetical protein